MILEIGSSSLISVALLFMMLFMGGLDSSSIILFSGFPGVSSNSAGPFDVRECNLCFVLLLSVFLFSSIFRWIYAVAMNLQVMCENIWYIKVASGYRISFPMFPITKNISKLISVSKILLLPRGFLANLYQKVANLLSFWRGQGRGTRRGPGQLAKNGTIAGGTIKWATLLIVLTLTFPHHRQPGLRSPNGGHRNQEWESWRCVRGICQ